MKDVIEALEARGLSVENIILDPHGLQTWTTRN